MHSHSQHSRLIQTVITTRSKPQLKSHVLAGLLIGAASLYAPMLNAAPIYKVVDEQTGQVTFTDRPQSYEQQAGKQVSQTGITTDTNASTSANTNNNNNNRSASSNTSSESVNNRQVAPKFTADIPALKAVSVNYQLTMTEPSEERAYHRPAQSIVVNLQLNPALQAGDSVSIYLDGNEVAQGLSASIATVDILPGKHSVTAVVKNETGQMLKQVERTVYVIQNTARLQNNKKIAQQLLAYQQLPWHQKVLLKLRQDSTSKQ
ncbi:DUF4124 domain-containing protein [Psychrobacter sp. LV10R520-6]|uniref:DUF4124 domain-containing protein n=1 Tax=Psychrobacter sp. LV10R520-6 TaxID=1415574 RepID=UPI0024C6BCF2|nr:DUF4124 domain-containing protein [Psychrobacter sp. LV10R520-6]SNT70076.1 protein of unknown function [Psychrobacter sp. LV10R520-6]